MFLFKDKKKIPHLIHLHDLRYYIYTYIIHTIVMTFRGSSEIAPNMNKHWVHV